jgi:acetamidase/formamidase
MNHQLLAVRANLHGIFHKTVPPVLWVDSGDVVSFQTLEVSWRTERVVADLEVARISPRVPVRDDGPALTGPVAVRGAKPGMALEVQMLAFRPGPWGWTSAGGPQSLMPGVGVESVKASLFWDIDVESGTASNQLGQQVELSPFFGTIGLASRDDEIVAGWKPHRRTAGNIDAKVLGAGTSLFLPIEVEGGLLSVGDGHACQGDGEIAGTAIECPMEEAELKLILHPAMSITAPRARTSDGKWVAFGLGETLDEAATMAVNGILDLLVELTGWTRSEALACATTDVDLRVTQMVNPLKGIHAVLKKDPFFQADSGSELSPAPPA